LVRRLNGGSLPIAGCIARRARSTHLRLSAHAPHVDVLIAGLQRLIALPAPNRPARTSPNAPKGQFTPRAAEPGVTRPRRAALHGRARIYRRNTQSETAQASTSDARRIEACPPASSNARPSLPIVNLLHPQDRRTTATRMPLITRYEELQSQPDTVQGEFAGGLAGLLRAVIVRSRRLCSPLVGDSGVCLRFPASGGRCRGKADDVGGRSARVPSTERSRTVTVRIRRQSSSVRLASAVVAISRCAMHGIVV
jgi:hypothetical protein